MHDLVVVPRAGGDDFLVARAAARPQLFLAGEPHYEYTTATADGVVAILAEEPSYDRARAQRWMMLLVPADADDASRARCDDLALRGYGDSTADWAVVRRRTRAVSAADLAEPAALERLHGALLHESVVGDPSTAAGGGGPRLAPDK